MNLKEQGTVKVGVEDPGIVAPHLVVTLTFFVEPTFS
jgi:hypothetical protein